MAEESIIRRLAAILVADVVGYSRMMEENEQATFEAFRLLRKAVLEPTVHRHSGRIVKFMGDGALVEFASAINAVECAIELQQSIVAANSARSSGPGVILRIGINLGEVIGEGSDIFGEGVNVAARLEGLSEPGGICMSEKVHNEVHKNLTIPMRDLGLVYLKNMTAPIRAFGLANAKPLSNVTQSLKREFTTIAVLPFSNMSGDPEHDYFIDGITEDIGTELGRFTNLSVVARNTTASLKGKSFDIADMVRQLGTDFVLAGSVRLAGDRIRATAQLVEAQSGTQVLPRDLTEKPRMSSMFKTRSWKLSLDECSSACRRPREPSDKRTRRRACRLTRFGLKPGRLGVTETNRRLENICLRPWKSIQTTDRRWPL